MTQAPAAAAAAAPPALAAPHAVAAHTVAHYAAHAVAVASFVAVVAHWGAALSPPSTIAAAAAMVPMLMPSGIGSRKGGKRGAAASVHVLCMCCAVLRCVSYVVCIVFMCVNISVRVCLYVSV